MSAFRLLKYWNDKSGIATMGSRPPDDCCARDGAGFRIPGIPRFPMIHDGGATSRQSSAQTMPEASLPLFVAWYSSYLSLSWLICFRPQTYTKSLWYTNKMRKNGIKSFICKSIAWFFNRKWYTYLFNMGTSLMILIGKWEINICMDESVAKHWKYKEILIFSFLFHWFSVPLHEFLTRESVRHS